MNYDSARQRTDGRWDYTTNSHPIGYCSGWTWNETYDPKKEWAYGSEDHWQKSKIKAEASKDKYHTGGHATAEEACECYKNYQLDNHLQLDRKSTNTMHKCKVCGTYTESMASVGFWQLYHLCDEQP